MFHKNSQHQRAERPTFLTTTPKMEEMLKVSCIQLQEKHFLKVEINQGVDQLQGCHQRQSLSRGVGPDLEAAGPRGQEKGLEVGRRLVAGGPSTLQTAARSRW